MVFQKLELRFQFGAQGGASLVGDGNIARCREDLLVQSAVICGRQAQEFLDLADQPCGIARDPAKGQNQQPVRGKRACQRGR